MNMNELQCNDYYRTQRKHLELYVWWFELTVSVEVFDCFCFEIDPMPVWLLYICNSSKSMDSFLCVCVCFVAIA